MGGEGVEESQSQEAVYQLQPMKKKKKGNLFRLKKIKHVQDILRKENVL